MDPGNPFGASSYPPAGNPFDPMGGHTAPRNDGGGGSIASNDNSSYYAAAQPPYAATPYAPPPNPFGQPEQPMQPPQLQQQPPQLQQQQQQQQPAYPDNSNALVPSTQPSNPYAGYAPPPTDQQQALVPAPSSGSPWAAAPAGYDPFAAPAPLPPQQDMYQPSNSYYGAPPPPTAPPVDDNPFGPFDAPSTAIEPYQAPAPHPYPDSYQQQQYPSVDAPLETNTDLQAYHPKDPPAYSRDANHYANAPDAEQEDRKNESLRYAHRDELAREAPPGAAPLPKRELVGKKGFVLSRISFRTIVMKKWKQSYWVQYGAHTMLWFRTKSDFEDWLNNPYHNHQQRNYLIKLAVNFVHDLYKPNVRGYQVTQCRSKPYGKKMVRQFKLERWMDYGPTIAAAFGSYDPKEVDALREALVDCMRNTPLTGGIRATGEVRRRDDSESGT